jgi:hypothetical protein
MPDPLDTLDLPPLDLGETMTMGSPPPQSAPNSKATAKQYAPLLALLPIAMAKGGQAGVAALLQGYQQARQQKAATTRQTGLDTEAQRRVNESERLRREQLAQQTTNNEAMRRQQLMQTFQGGLEKLDTPESVRAYMALMGPQAQAVGLRPEALDAFAMEAMTPTRLQQREASRVLEEAKKQYGEQASANVYTLKDGTAANWATLNQRAGVSLGSQGQTSGDDLRKSSIDVQAADALARGDMESYARLKRVADEMSGARRADQPPGTDPRKIATFNQIAGAFERSPLVRAADRTIVLSDAVREIDANPSDPASQLKLAYAYIQALDTYQSAVREGELQNLGMLGTRLQQWATELNKVAFEGAFIPPEVARNIAVSAKQLVQTIDAGRQRKAQEFRSRAQVSGVGDMWDAFVVGSAPPEPTTLAPPPTPRADRSRNRVLPPPSSGPRAGERRTAPDGRVAEWDGTGWKVVRTP